MEKINLVELLKDCPKGMELNCTMFNGLEFDCINTKSCYPIQCRVKRSDGEYIIYAFDKYGHWNDYFNAKCVIFPKGKTTWEGFKVPFKDGDVVSTNSGMFIAIVRRVIKCETKDLYNHNEDYETYCYILYKGDDEVLFCTNATPLCFDRLAYKKEKEKLFQAIKDNGYKWNTKTKTLEKLIKPKFKVGDKIVNDGYVVEIIEVNIESEIYGYKSKFCGIGGILFTEQDNWELVPDKFDVTTLKPFDKVLARCSSLEKWRIQFFEKFDKTCKFPFICMDGRYSLCIPYSGNEHLHDTTTPCSDYYLI